MSLFDEEPSRLSMKRLLLKIAGPRGEFEAPMPKRRSCSSHSATLLAICFIVGLVTPAILVTSVAYFKNSLVVAQGCQQTGDAAAFSFTFTCNSFPLTKVAIILACVHIAVGSICTLTAWELTKRWARRQLDKMKEDNISKLAGIEAVRQEELRRLQEAREEELKQINRNYDRKARELKTKLQLAVGDQAGSPGNTGDAVSLEDSPNLPTGPQSFTASRRGYPVAQPPMYAAGPGAQPPMAAAPRAPRSAGLPPDNMAGPQMPTYQQGPSRLPQEGLSMGGPPMAPPIIMNR